VRQCNLMAPKRAQIPTRIPMWTITQDLYVQALLLSAMSARRDAPIRIIWSNRVLKGTSQGCGCRRPTGAKTRSASSDSRSCTPKQSQLQKCREGEQDSIERKNTRDKDLRAKTVEMPQRRRVVVKEVWCLRAEMTNGTGGQAEHLGETSLE
jgi:hypothetical protein